MWFPFLRRTRRIVTQRPARPSYRPRLQALEDRCLMSTGWAVSNAGSGTMGMMPAVSQPDASGNLYVTGYFSGTATFGSTTLNAASESSYVAKIDPNGNFLWATQFGGSTGDAPSAIALDTTGSLYVTGNFGGTATFGNTILTSVGSSDIYICKLDGNGNMIWARQAGGASGDVGQTITVDPNGNVVVSGWFDHGGSTVVSATFGSTTLTATCCNVQGMAPVFLTKLDSNGNFLWAEQLLNGTYGQASGMSSDGNGNMYIVGGGNAFQGSNNSGFIEKVDSNGSLVWAVGTIRPMFAAATFTDRVTGTTSLYTAIWPTSTAPANVQKLDASSGSVLWSEAYGAPADVRGRAMTLDASGNVYIVGQFSGVGDFDPGPGTADIGSKNSWDAFLEKLAPSGNLLSARRMGGSMGSGIALDPSGDIYTVGQYQGTQDFDTGSQTVFVTSPGNNSLFVCKTTQDMGMIFGQVFNDLNNNGIFDSSSSNPETGIPNVTVYLDTNNNGVLDPGEPTAVTDATGLYDLNHVPAGSNAVRQVPPAGWTQTSPASNGANMATLSSGQLIDSELFGNYIPSQTKSYSSTNVPLKLGTKSGASLNSTLTISDAYPIFDIKLSINVTTTSNSLAFTLTAPDGTLFQVQPGNTDVTSFNYHHTKGTWTLHMWNQAPAPKPSTLNAWSMTIQGATVPQIGSFTASANPVTSGGSETLTASNITDANAGTSITQVVFYYYDNSGVQQILGYGTQTKSGVWSLTFTVALPAGSYTIYAQAQDSKGLFSDPFALALTVQ